MLYHFMLHATDSIGEFRKAYSVFKTLLYRMYKHKYYQSLALIIPLQNSRIECWK